MFTASLRLVRMSPILLLSLVLCPPSAWADPPPSSDARSVRSADLSDVVALFTDRKHFPFKAQDASAALARLGTPKEQRDPDGIVVTVARGPALAVRIFYQAVEPAGTPARHWRLVEAVAYIIERDGLDARLQELAEAMRAKLGKPRSVDKAGDKIRRAVWMLRKPYEVELGRPGTELPDGRTVDHLEITVAPPDDD